MLKSGSPMLGINWGWAAAFNLSSRSGYVLPSLWGLKVQIIGPWLRCGTNIAITVKGIGTSLVKAKLSASV